MAEEVKVGERTADELIAAIREKLLGLRTVPFASVNKTGEAIEWLLRDLERAVRTLEAKYDYAKEAATCLYKRGGTMRAAQRHYFKDRNYANLQAAQGAERVFDAVLAAVQSHGKPQQAEFSLGGKEAAHA